MPHVIPPPGYSAAIEDALFAALGDLEQRFPPTESPGAQRYWHGGRNGLPVGDHIVPMGAKCGLVHITKAKWIAVMYAALCKSPGTVYEVEPVGTLTPIEGRWRPPGVVLHCDRARIVAVQDLAPDLMRRLLHAYQAWHRARWNAMRPMTLAEPPGDA